jgi:hypothetical protein
VPGAHQFTGGVTHRASPNLMPRTAIAMNHTTDAIPRVALHGDVASMKKGLARDLGPSDSSSPRGITP